MPLIDIIMPVRNGEPFLPAALDSLAVQTCQDFRLVVCDDGSSDRTAAILRAESRFPVLLVQEATSLGVTVALNKLLSLPSDATYVARFDADDICEPDRLHQQVRFLEKHPAIGLVGSWMKIIDGRGHRVGCHHYPTDPDAVRTELIFSNPLAHPAIMARAEVLRRLPGPYNPEYQQAQDFELWCRLDEQTRMANIPRELVRYRRHGDAVGVARKSAQIANIERVRRAQVNRLKFSADSHSLLLDLLSLDADPTPVTPARLAHMLAEFDARFPRGRSAHTDGRRDDLALAGWRRLSHADRLNLALRDKATALAYLQRKLALGLATWRHRIGLILDDRRCRRLARRLRQAILRSGGRCPPDLRIYGDSSREQRIRFGARSILEHGCSIWISGAEQGGQGSLIAGDHLFVGFNTRINVFADIRIGQEVSIGANSYLASNNHNYQLTDISIQAQGFSGSPIVIEDDVWLGCHVTVLPGVRIGRGAVVGAGSVVTKSVPAGEVWAGVPARRIAERGQHAPRE